MNINDIYELVQWGSTIIGSLAGWFAGRYSRKSNSLQKMQDTIDMLVEKNMELYAEVTAVRRENAELKAGQERISLENAELKQQLAELKQK